MLRRRQRADEKDPAQAGSNRENRANLGEQVISLGLAASIFAACNVLCSVVIVVNEDGVISDGVLFAVIASVLAFALIQVYTADVFKGDNGIQGVNQLHWIFLSFI